MTKKWQRLLVVDDEVGIRELLSEILRDRGHDILLAENAAAARRATRCGPDMVLLDIWMPTPTASPCSRMVGGQRPAQHAGGDDVGRHHRHRGRGHAHRRDRLPRKPIALQKLLSAVKRGLQRPQAPAVPVGAHASPPSSLVPLRELRADSSRSPAARACCCCASARLARRAGRARPAAERAYGWTSRPSPRRSTCQLQAAGRRSVRRRARPPVARAAEELAFALDRLERYADLRLVAATDRSLEALVGEGWEEARSPASRSVRTAVDRRRARICPELAKPMPLHLVEAGEVPLRRLTAALNQLRNQPCRGGYPELRVAVKSLALGTLGESIGAERSVAPAAAGSSAAARRGVPLDQFAARAREAFERMYFEHHLRLEGGNMTRLAEKTGPSPRSYRKSAARPAGGRRHEES